MRKIVFIGFFLFTGWWAMAQEITIDFPLHAQKPLIVTLKAGTKQDTIYAGTFDKEGIARISLPKEYSTYRGMATVSLENKGYMDFIVSDKENPIVKCKEEYPHGGNTTFENSLENGSLQKWFTSQAVRMHKTGLLSELVQVYKKEDSLTPMFEQEKLNIENEQSEFEAMLFRSNLYASRFISLHNYLGREISGLVFADSLKMEETRRFVRDNLDISSLYTSGLWFDVLNGLLAVYDNDSPFHDRFVDDMSALLNRCKSDRVYMTLAEDLFTICENTGWNDLAEQLAYFLINDGRVTNPQGKLQMLMTLFKLSKGSKIPDLTQGRLPEGKFLLVFYESGCGPCENEMEMLKANYQLFKEQGYSVVSVSADTDRDIFRNTSETFPWQDKHCDMKGLSGDDFKNYGVVGTPTFYVIDENKIVRGRYARLSDTGLIN